MEAYKSHKTLEFKFFASKKTVFLYMCQICRQVPNPSAAVEHADCGKIFCSPCIANWARTSELCSSCKKPFHDSRPNLSIALKRTMLSAVVVCPNTPPNSEKCSWEGEWEELYLHERECLYTLLPCPCKCGKEIMRKDVEQHTKIDCSNKIVTCSFCQKDLTLNLLKEHENNCELNMEAVIGCRYAAVGCESRFKRHSQTVHDKELADVHLKLVTKHFNTLQDRIKLIEEEAKSTVPKCKDGHDLKFMVDLDIRSNYYCDLCFVRHIPYRAGTWKCKPCDFDMCNSCYYNKFIKR
eukprot:TRINITY_DN15341_c0_g2_i11.p1 TRINITY_DN15341_c0_g2~~TRINITY_DN15341_c0_g2_i11.p1  ORF type:complete len:295 (-),score=37.10 TRINITY_DN15341_c0_g2_i11:100-984(-)